MKRNKKEQLSLPRFANYFFPWCSIPYIDKKVSLWMLTKHFPSSPTCAQWSGCWCWCRMPCWRPPSWGCPCPRRPRSSCPGPGWSWSPGSWRVDTWTENLKVRMIMQSIWRHILVIGQDKMGERLCSERSLKIKFCALRIWGDRTENLVINRHKVGEY